MMDALKDNVKQAQDRMKQHADKRRSKRALEVGVWVYLKIQSYKHITTIFRTNRKLSSKYFRPYQVIRRVGEVAYRLQLPPGSLIHPVFHISHLKKRVGECVIPQVEPPLIVPNGQVMSQPVAALGKRMIKKHNKAVVQNLV